MTRLDQLRALFTAPAADLDDERRRSHERYRRAALSSMAGLAARALQLAASLITLRMTLHYLGEERYGMWVVISTTMTMFTFADLGIGNGLLNALATAHGREDRASASASVSSAFFALTGLATVLGVAFAIAYPLVPWARVFNVRSAVASAEAGPALAVFVASFLVSMPLGVVQRIRLGHQEGFIDNAWTTAGNLAAFAAVLLAVALRVSLPWLVVAMMSVPVMVQLVNAAVLFHRAYPWLRPRWSEVRVASARAVMSTGGYFFLLQVAGAVAYQSDALILAQMIDAEATARYGVAMKLFQIMPMLMTFLHAALWPAYGEAMARGDVDWVRRTLRRSLWLAAIASGGTSMVVIAIGQPVIRWWLGPAVVPTLLMLVAMGTWTTISVVSNALGAFLNGAGILRAQAMAALLMMVANVGLSILFTRWVGASGVVWGSVVSQTVFVLVPMGIYLRWWFARQSPVAGAA